MPPAVNAAEVYQYSLRVLFCTRLPSPSYVYATPTVPVRRFSAS